MPRYSTHSEPSSDKMPPLARQAWEFFLTRILHHWRDDAEERFLRQIQDELPVYGIEKPRAIGRIQAWLSGDSIPCAPVGLAIFIMAMRNNFLTAEDLMKLFSFKATNPNKP